MPKKQNLYPYNDTDDRWVTTAQSSFQRTTAASPSMKSPSQQKRDLLHAAWELATSPQAASVSRSWEGVYSARPLPEHDPRVDWQPMGTYSAGGLVGTSTSRGATPFLSTTQRARAQTPPPGALHRSSFSTSSELPMRHGRRPVASRCTDDHIVFENTRYEDSSDPLFYATQHEYTDGPGPHAHSIMRIASPHHHQTQQQQFASPRGGGYTYEEDYDDDEDEENDGTDWGGLVEQFGFPGKRHTVARRRRCTGLAQERTMNLFSRQVDHKTPPRGEGPRRHLLPQRQAMTDAFQAAGEEVPFFRGGKRVALRDHEQFDATQRVLRTELQSDDRPYRAQVRVGGLRPQDELSATLQGSATPQRETRRQFFDFRR